MSKCYVLKAVNGFIPKGQDTSGYFGSDESLDNIIDFINKEYPGVTYELNSFNKFHKLTKILIKETNC